MNDFENTKKKVEEQFPYAGYIACSNIGSMPEISARLVCTLIQNSLKRLLLQFSN